MKLPRRLALTRTVMATLKCVKEYMDDAEKLAECLEKVATEEWRTHIHFAISLLMLQHGVPNDTPIVAMLPSQDSAMICIYDCDDEKCLNFMEDLALLLEEMLRNTVAMVLTRNDDRICIANIRWKRVRETLL